MVGAHGKHGNSFFQDNSIVMGGKTGRKNIVNFFINFFQAGKYFGVALGKTLRCFHKIGIVHIKAQPVFHDFPETFFNDIRVYSTCIFNFHALLLTCSKISSTDFLTKEYRS